MFARRLEVTRWLLVSTILLGIHRRFRVQRVVGVQYVVEGTLKGWRRTSLFGRIDDTGYFWIRSDSCPLSITRWAIRGSSKSWCSRKTNVSWEGWISGGGWQTGAVTSIVESNEKIWTVFSRLAPEETSCRELSFCALTNFLRRAGKSYNPLKTLRS